MNVCENCGGKLINVHNSKYLVCEECGLVSDQIIFQNHIIRKEEVKIKEKRKRLSYTTIISYLDIPKKYSKNITDSILNKLLVEEYSIRNKYKLRKKFFEIYYFSNFNNDKEILKIYNKIKKYINIAKVFLNGKCIDALYYAIMTVYFIEKNNLNINIDRVAKFYNISKSNLIKRYKEFKKIIKLYEKISARKLLLFKILGQKRLANLTISEIGFILGLKYNSLKSIYSNLKKQIKNQEQVLQYLKINRN